MRWNIAVLSDRCQMTEGQEAQASYLSAVMAEEGPPPKIEE